MPIEPETKHDKFLRLMTKRLGRALEEMRLITQLASANYENTPEEAQEVILHLDKSVRSIAKVFGVPYKTSLTQEKGRRVGKQMGSINEIDIAKAIEHIQNDRPEEAVNQLRAAMNQDPR